MCRLDIMCVRLVYSTSVTTNTVAPCGSTTNGAYRVSRGAAGSLHELTKEPSSSSKPHSTLSAPIHGRSLIWAFLASACFSSSAIGESRTWLIHDAGSLLPPLCWSSTALGRAIADSRRSTVIVTVLPW